MSYITGNDGKVAGVNGNPLVVTLTGDASPGGGGSTPSKYPESVTVIANTTANSGQGTYTATDNVTITLSLVDSGTTPDTQFTGYTKFESDPEMVATGFRRTNGYDEVTQVGSNNTVSWDIPAGFTFILKFTATTEGTRSAKGTVTI